MFVNMLKCDKLCKTYRFIRQCNTNIAKASGSMSTMSSKMSMTDEELRQYFPDFPSGPLDVYRKNASFDWRRIKLSYDTSSSIKLKHDIWKFMESNPLFQHSDKDLSLDEIRHITVKRMYAIFNENFLPYERIVEDPRIFQAKSEALFMYDSSLSVKMSLTFRMFANTIQAIGRPHHYHFVEDIQEGKIGGCFALTEVSHGSNAKGMRTTATYCPETKQFIMHTDDFEAAKFWVGSLGQCATHAIIYAKLISKGENHGLHAFVVPIRDPKTLKPYPGVVVGDIGRKVGLNGIDNGFVVFNKYAIPKENALDKLGGVDDDGDYKTPFKDPSKRFGASLGALSGGRVHITSISANYLQKAVVIALRYSAVRRQFGPEGEPETPVLEYQMQQVRLLPQLAATFALRIFCTWFGETHVKMTVDSLFGQLKNAAELGLEVHALSSATKPVCAWAARDGIQICREACGGHGYLEAARIGELRNDNDANCTYEGENSLLLQQASNWLLALWPRRGALTPADTPLASLDFLRDADEVLKMRCQLETVDEFVEPENIIQIYRWLCAHVLRSTHARVDELRRAGRDQLRARNESQAHHAALLSVVYGENFMLNHFYKSVREFPDASCRAVLLRLVALYGVSLLDKHLATLYIGGYFSGEQGACVRAGAVRLCAALAPDAVALADALAPPDFCLRSVLGASDGQVYKHIQSSVMSSPGALSRPSWWRDVVHWRDYVQAKL